MTPATSDHPRVVVAPDKFKGSLTAAAVAEHLAIGIRRARPGAYVTALPVADGGEGTLDAAVAAGYQRIPVTVTGPTGLPVAAAFAIRGNDAVIELASASGLALLPDGRPEPLRATSRGTGELLLAALNRGAKAIVLGVGGSATTDGGAGMIQALGGRLLDRSGTELAAGGIALNSLHRIDLAGLDPRLADTSLVLASDVDNPLLGSDGAAAIYGPQKGASPAQVAALEAALTRWADLVDPDQADLPGAGAAGGVGYAALAILHAHRQSGANTILDLIRFRQALHGARMVLTGEGRLDRQTMRGKAPAAVAAAARASGISVIAVCGQREIADSELAELGIRAAYALADGQPDLRRSMAEAGPLLAELGAAIATAWLAD